MINYKIKTELTGERTKYTDAVFTTGDVRGYRLTFEFTENGKPVDISGHMLTVKAKRADGIIITDSGTVEKNVAYYDVKNSMISVAGELSLEIALSDSDGMYLTALELIASVRYGYGEGDLKGTDTTPILSTLLATTERAKESAESAKESADIAEESAKNAKESADIAEESAKNAVDTATTALNRKNYDYIRRDLRFENQIISVIPNAVMYIYNSAESVDFDTVHLALVDSDNPIDDLAEEYVLILDFTNMTSIPEIILDEYIKWLDGEPPVIEAGKVYMFSFVKVREETYSTLFYLGIGGEFN